MSTAVLEPLCGLMPWCVARSPATKELTCKTATGEYVASGNAPTITRRGAWDQRAKPSGHKAAVHKPLASAR